jgi:hypothetical protein
MVRLAIPCGSSGAAASNTGGAPAAAAGGRLGGSGGFSATGGTAGEGETPACGTYCTADSHRVRGQPRQRHIDERFTVLSAIDATEESVLLDCGAKRDQGRGSVGQKLRFQDRRRSWCRGWCRTFSLASASKNDRKPKPASTRQGRSTPGHFPSVTRGRPGTDGLDRRDHQMTLWQSTTCPVARHLCERKLPTPRKAMPSGR